MRPLAANLRVALQGGYTQGMAGAVSESVSVQTAQSVIREMLKRMKTGEKLTCAATTWSLERLLRKRISLVGIQP